jgi:hypothetical protein
MPLVPYSPLRDESPRSQNATGAEPLCAMGTFVTARSQGFKLAHARAGATRWAVVLIPDLLAQSGVAMVQVEKKGPTVAVLFPRSFVIVTALAVSVWTHERTIALPKTPLVAALRSAVTGG